MTISRLGSARPDSTKLRWRVEISASVASSNWLMRRRMRQSRSISPTLRRPVPIGTAVTREASVSMTSILAKDVHRTITSEVMHRLCAADIAYMKTLVIGSRRVFLSAFTEGDAIA